MGDAREAGRVLAERHARMPAEPMRVTSVLNFAESPRAGDWTLRSALVRLALPKPQLVADLLTLVRRLDAVLGPLASNLERHTVVCDRALATELGEPLEPYPDARVVDLARLVAASGAGEFEVVAGYQEVSDLTEDESAAIGLAGVALMFDSLADALAQWAEIAPAPAPTYAVQATIDAARERLDELGVPEEQGPPRGRGRRS